MSLHSFKTKNGGHHPDPTPTSLISDLQARLEAVVPIDRTATSYCLLDFPDYPNVGDSLIWLGAERFLSERYGSGASYLCTTDNFDPDELCKLAPTGPIYLSGGGNFGDLWPKFQKFRIAVLENFPDRPVIQLPQTIHFSDSAAAGPTRAAIAKHRHFTLLVRDEPSSNFARDVLGCDALLAPDTAFCLGPLKGKNQPVFDVAVMLRTDKEKGSRGELNLPAHFSINSFDWIHGDKHSFVSRIAARLERTVGLPTRLQLYRHKAERQLQRGSALLSSGRTVVTDRLHGHILATLLGIPHVIADNSYGKLKNFNRLWTWNSPISGLVEDLAEAGEMLSRLR